MNKDLTAAGATPIILALLAEEESYGYALIRRVQEGSHHTLQWPEGMLYPILHRLEQQGYLASRFSDVNSGRRRKYYRTTEKGLDYLRELSSDWQHMHRFLSQTLQAAGLDIITAEGKVREGT